jgi:ribosome-associated protein
MINITKNISIDEREIKEEFIRSSGPGGQNVNKVATAVQLRFNAADSPSLPEEVRKRLIRLAGKRVTANGVLIITARRFRAQEKNREDALIRLISLIREAARNPKYRKKTIPTVSSVRNRLNSKHKKSELKKSRLDSRIYEE